MIKQTRRWRVKDPELAWKILRTFKLDCSTTAPRFSGKEYYIVEATGTPRQLLLLESKMEKIRATPTKEGYFDGLNHRNPLHKVTELPPDPEDMNDQRAEWAAGTLVHFRTKEGRCDEGDALSDLLSDIAHHCDREGISLVAEMRRAGFHYLEETAGEGHQFDELPVS